MATLYRKYRSQSFDEVIGQEPIVTTLTNQIKLGRISHAYLFTGSRGIGKTSCARIFARAVNCLHPVNGSPCGECEVCKKLAADNVDIIELDAASNNGVDDARDIREKVKYAPVSCKYKVYIIDEVHMLTGGAFNALLKTIEEPPEHVIFILATTEPQKLPQTILSRCIRFDFKLVPTEDLAKHIAKVYDSEGIKYTYPAVEEIARLGAGSVRDALSVADTLCSAADVITPEVVLSLTGAGDSAALSELFDKTASRDLKGVLNGVDRFVKNGRSMPTVARQLIEYTRNVLVAKSVGRDAARSLINTDGASFDSICSAADKYALADISRMLEQLSAAEAGLKYSVNPRVFLETTLIKLVCGADRDDDIMKRLTALEKNSAFSAEQKKNKVIFRADPSADKIAPVSPQKKAGGPENFESSIDAADSISAPDSFSAPDPASARSKSPKKSAERKISPSAPSAVRDSRFDPPIDRDVSEPPPESDYRDYSPAPEDYGDFAPPPEDYGAPPYSASPRSRKPEIVRADEGEFFHNRAVPVTGKALTGKVAGALRRSNGAAARRALKLLAQGVKVIERVDAIAFVSPADVFLSMSEGSALEALNKALDAAGIKKRAVIERTEDDMYNADLDAAKRLFGRDCVVEAELPRSVG